MFEFTMPDLGEGIEAGQIISVLVGEGDSVRAEQNVLEVETDKVVLEVPVPVGGRVAHVHVKPGDRVPVGGVLLSIDESSAPTAVPAPPPTPATPEPAVEPVQPTPAAEVVTPAPPSPAAVAAVEVVAPPVAAAPAPSGELPPPAGPATRRLARELGVDLARVQGSGPGGRITEEDVRAYVRQVATGGPPTPPAARPPAPAAAALLGGLPPLPDFSQWGPVERRPISGIRRATAEHLTVAWRLIPHVTQFDLADITDIETARRQFLAGQEGLPRVTITTLAVKAVVAALKRYPQFNSSFDAEAGEIVYKSYYHIGIAVDTEAGLMVPVLRDADRKGILQMAIEMTELAERARQRKLDLAELRGGTFTITNLGGIGGTAFTPIVNHPEVAILGLSRARQEQIIRNGQPEIRLMLPLSLSYDHRVIDGADGARFLRLVAELLSDPMQLLFAT